MYFDMPGDSTLHHKGEKMVIIRTKGHKKDMVTDVFAVMAGCKLPPMVVHRMGKQLMTFPLVF